jgi:methyl-accepting chemotaxis protein
VDLLSATATSPTGGMPAYPAHAVPNVGGPLHAADALALTIGARLTGSTLIVGCVLALVLGASSLLDSMQKLDVELKAMSAELAVAQVGMNHLNKSMDSLPATADSLATVLTTINGTAEQVKISSQQIDHLDTNTASLNEDLGAIAKNTTVMRTSMASVDAGSGKLGTTINTLSGKIDPLVTSQHETVGQLGRMRTGINGMNSSLAYVIRVLNYITAPPTGQGFTVRVNLPKETLPPIPGVKAETDPVGVFPRGAWNTYTGP